MAAPMLLKKSLDICKNIRPVIRQFHNAKNIKSFRNKYIYIGAPCACYVAVLTWRKLTNSPSLVPVVNAASEVEVRHN